MVNLITEHMEVWTTAQVKKSNGGRGRGNNSNGQSSYGLKKLREFILELAVRGKLVPQDPRDEPASLLLERIDKEKTRLIKEGKIRKQKPLPDIAADEKQFNLPEGWEWSRLGDSIEFVNGFAFKSNDFSDSGVGIVKIGDIQNGEIVTTSMSRVDESIVADLDDSLRVYKEDMLIAMSGATTGKLGFNTTDEVFYINQRVGKIAPYFISIRYLFYPLTTKIAENLSKSMGSAIPNLSTTQIKNIVIAIPPIAEQQRIVAKVDELMALCDRLEQQQTDSNETHQTLVETLLATLTNATDQRELAEAWQRIANHFDTLFTTEHSIDQLKQTILQLSVMGKLISQDPDDEPAGVLIERLKAKRELLLKEGKIQRAKFIQTIDENDYPYRIPETWIWTRLSFISEVIDPNPSHRMPRYVGSGIPFISTENFADEDKINFAIGKQVTEETLQQQKERFELRAGSFALTRIGTIGKTRPLPLERNYCMSHALCVISPFDDELNTDYLRLVVTADSVLDQARSGTKSIGVPDLGMGVIRSFLIPLPPNDEQSRIVIMVKELMAICDALKSELLNAQTTQVQLAVSIVEETEV